MSTMEAITTSAAKDLEAAGRPQELRRRTRSHKGPRPVSRPFAGRIGGNQEFIVSKEDALEIKIPDASASFTWYESFCLDAFADIRLWKEAIIEGVGTLLQTWLSGLVAVGLAPLVQATSLGPVTPAAIGSLFTGLLIALFIFSGGPVSGGHFNPLITIATFCARLSIFPRTVLYVSFQALGAVIGGFLLRGGLGKKPSDFPPVAGCYVDTSIVTPAQAYTLETLTCCVLIFLAFGVGLDPRQAKVFGPALSPFLVGLSLAICTFASSIVREGYSGASCNPARCLGLGVASGHFQYHYIHWSGPITAAILNGILYYFIPIYEE